LYSGGTTRPLLTLLPPVSREKLKFQISKHEFQTQISGFGGVTGFVCLHA
jgi:hypothetical protein